MEIEVEQGFETLDGKIAKFDTEVRDYQLALNKEAIWLFLAVLGCWSVPEGTLRGIAFFLSLLIFGWQLFSQLPNQTPFDKQTKGLENEINASKILDLTQRDALKHRLTESRNRLKFWPHLRRCWIWIATAAFFLVSIVHPFLK